MPSFKDCIDCANRTITPSCKATCEKYIKAKAKFDQTKAERRKDREIELFKLEAYSRDWKYRKAKSSERKRHDLQRIF